MEKYTTEIEESMDPDDVLPEVHIENTDETPVLNIVLDPNDPQNSVTFATAGAVPLFIKKLWKIVNDPSNEHIIGWNQEGNGFIIEDQIQFLSKTLPRYFKHNQMSSFVRQLNMYGFHKIQPLVKEEPQFNHPFFIRNMPELLPFIKRKPPVNKAKTEQTAVENPPEPPPQQVTSDIQELKNAIKDIRTKNEIISKKMANIKQENADLWGEIHSLRSKYSHQAKIINKLIHFLISYMQKHHNTRKSGRTVSSQNANKYLKTGPKIMELDYRYKNNPHKFWSDFDSRHDQHENVDLSDSEVYTVVEPIENADTGNQAQASLNSPSIQVSSTIEELLPGSNVYSQVRGSPANQSLPQVDYSRPSSSKASNSALQRAGKSKDVGYLIDNSRVELNTIKELFKHLTPEDMSTFYKLVNENLKHQEDDLEMEAEAELDTLQEIPIDTAYEEPMEEEDMEPLGDIMNSQEVGTRRVLTSHPDTSQTSSVLHNSQASNSGVPFTEIPAGFSEMPTEQTDKIVDENYGLMTNEFLNADDFLTDISVDQYFNLQ